MYTSSQVRYGSTTNQTTKGKIMDYDNENLSFESNETIVLGGGGVQYAAKDAAVRIDDLIAALQEAKEEGAEHVLMASGNYRGAQWASIGTDWSWMDDE